MIDNYPPVLRAFFRMVGQRWLEMLEAELWKFSQALNNWLYELFLHPTPDWRERLSAFEAEQEAEGRTLTPESRTALVDYLEVWARGAFVAAEDTPALADREAPAGGIQQLAMAHPRPAPPKAVQTPQGKPNHYATGEIIRKRFWQKIDEAKRHLAAIEPALKRIAEKIDSAAEGDPIDVMPDVEEIESLVWSHNAAMESARHTWLDAQMSAQDTIDALMNMSTPVAHGLPMFFDRAQAERARLQRKEITRRLDAKVKFLDNTIAVMEALETAGNVATVILTGGAVGGVILTAVKTGSKIVLVRGAAAFGAGYAASYAIGKVAEAGARAAGFSEETITRVQNAAEVVSWLITLKQVRRGNLKDLEEHKRKSAEPQQKQPDSSRGPTSPDSTALVPTGIVRDSNDSRVYFEDFEVRGVRDLSHLDVDTLQRMADFGIAGADVNGVPIQLHHLAQNPAGPIVEIPKTRHTIANRIQHPRGNAKGVGLSKDERNAFSAWRIRYWKARALEELAKRGVLRGR